MKTAKRYVHEYPDIYKVVGLSFKPEVHSTPYEDKTKIRFKIGDWEEPINFIPYFNYTDQKASEVH
jgi:hypothetical protein